MHTIVHQQQGSVPVAPPTQSGQQRRSLGIIRSATLLSCAGFLSLGLVNQASAVQETYKFEPEAWLTYENVKKVQVSHFGYDVDHPKYVTYTGTGTPSQFTLCSRSGGTDTTLYTGTMSAISSPTHDGLGGATLYQGNFGPSNYTFADDKTKTYVIKPRVAGTMYYHCHVQPHTHIPMGLAGMFIVEENRPNNWPQVFNVGAGQVRHPSVAVLEKYSQEYDLHYQSVDKQLHQLPQSANDPRLIAKAMNQEYDITEAKDDYFLLNGRSFPYTLRESMIAVNPNEKVKLRVLNGFTEHMALHTHGHKATETHYDGVEQNPAAQITRDVYSMGPAQRLDLALDTTDDGLHSYGAGVWMFHDHVEKTFTTDGMGEGGAISLITYKSYLDESGAPKTHGMDLKPYFTKEFWQRKIPVWQDWGDDWGSLGAPAGTMDADPAATAKAAALAAAPSPLAATPSANGTGGGLFSGLLLGIVGYLLYLHRERVLALIGQIASLTKSKP